MNRKILCLLGLFVLFSCEINSSSELSEVFENTRGASELVVHSEYADESSKGMRKRMKEDLQIIGEKVSDVWFTDAQGEHYLILSNTGKINDMEFPESGDKFYDVELYTYLFTTSSEALILDWMIKDSVVKCGPEIYAEFGGEAYDLTDLDNDGMKEVWINYSIGCNSKNVPLKMRVIMTENKSQYVMDGEKRVKIGPDNFKGGDYTFGENVSNIATSFKDHFKKIWKEQVDQVF